LPGLTVGMFVAGTAGQMFASHLAGVAESGPLTFVGATATSALIAFVGLFGRHPAEGDVRWYLRPQNQWIYRIGGVFVFAATLHITGLV
jgi:hypothetical protein